jgi:hypothetical protein
MLSDTDKINLDQSTDLATLSTALQNLFAEAQLRVDREERIKLLWTLVLTFASILPFVNPTDLETSTVSSITFQQLGEFGLVVMVAFLAAVGDNSLRPLQMRSESGSTLYKLAQNLQTRLTKGEICVSPEQHQDLSLILNRFKPSTFREEN